MRWIACSLFYIITLISASIWARPEVVRVRIKTNISRVFLSGLNIRLIGHEERFSKVSIPQTKQMQISHVMVAGKNYWQVSQGNSTELKEVMTLMVQGENLRQDSTELPNKILLQEGEDGQIDTIGIVPMEEYVFSVLASEMPLRWPIETLKAQAIAIRSYTMAILNARKDKNFHMESSVLDQVYKKIASNADQKLLDKARSAVKATEGVFLLNRKGNVLKAFYHSDCGGRTVLASSVWRQEKDNDAGVAVDTSCPSNPMARWSYNISKQKFASLMLNFIGDIRSNEFRKILGFMNLKSTHFEMIDKADQIEFVGKGFGHGVGMCQWGSRTLGLRSFSYQRILKHYYPLASLSILENQD